jgi:exosortase
VDDRLISNAHARSTASVVLGVRDFAVKYFWELISLAFLCAIFWRYLWVTFTVTNDDHQVIISYITLGLIWHKREALRSAEKKMRFWALAPLLVLLALVYFTNPALFFLNALLFPMIVAAWALLFFGWQFLSVLAFPLGFYFAYLYYLMRIARFFDLQFTLRLISTRFAGKLLNLLGETANVRGTQIAIHGFQSSIDPACSGLNNLFAFMVISTLIAYATNTTLLRKVIICAIGVPLAVFSNGLRVTGLILLIRSYGTMFEKGFWHDFVGVAAFAVAMCAFPVLIEILRREKTASRLAA